MEIWEEKDLFDDESIMTMEYHDIFSKIALKIIHVSINYNLILNIPLRFKGFPETW